MELAFELVELNSDEERIHSEFEEMDWDVEQCSVGVLLENYQSFDVDS